MSHADERPDEIVTLLIELADTDPLIWRRLEVPTSMTLKVLHDVVQAAMGWFDYHLWELSLGSRRFGLVVPGEDDGEPPLTEARRVRLRDLLDRHGKTVLGYTYDFGDGWEHRLTFTGVRLGEPGTDYPRYVAGERAAPPEDCGGVPGFYNGLDILADPQHPEHEDVAEWFGAYDPNHIDVELIGFALSRIARRRRSASIRRGA